jgi:hypothetical protein
MSTSFAAEIHANLLANWQVAIQKRFESNPLSSTVEWTSTQDFDRADVPWMQSILVPWLNGQDGISAQLYADEQCHNFVVSLVRPRNGDVK